SEEYKNFRRKFMKTEEFQSEYKSKIENSLIALRQIGNSYTASVWLGVESHFETRNDDLAGKRFGIGSYGSGSSAIVCSFIVQPEYKEVVKKMDLMRKLDERQRIPIDVYEDLHEGRLKLHESVIPPKNEFALVSFGNKSYDCGYRYYRYIT
ncbi:MAG TPA: 3-hydroxy-3-methylglutaryl-CoA synthase, partial [Candidatus Bathyarchaeota archaeon]|nr:3-hydroxy-3-methylglutaryl-CoA synthase [Candidatus Bathyarchaeota archaeon]